MFLNKKRELLFKYDNRHTLPFHYGKWFNLVLKSMKEFLLYHTLVVINLENYLTSAYLFSQMLAKLTYKE